ncbi:MAG: DUF4258 domain-containing protein [Candidatus Humimicrobiaceae bacterium]
MILNEHGFKIDKSIIIETIKNPDILLGSYAGRVIIQKKYNNEYLIRIIVEIIESYIKVITVYPAKRRRYEYKI